MEPSNKRKMFGTINLVLTILAGCLVVMDIVLVVMFYDELFPAKPIVEKTSDLTEQQLISSCTNLSIGNTTRCTIRRVYPYFIYNATNDRLELSFNQLMGRGGDCKDWSELYERVGEAHGFFSKLVVIDISNYSAHAITIWSNSHGFCVLNQLDYYCSYIGNFTE